MMAGLLAYASYLPAFRLAGSDIGTPKRDRVVASYDEDSTTMAVAAAAQALRGRPTPSAVYFATSSPAYADKTNAAAIHAALDLAPEVFAADLCGSGRSGFAAIRTAAAGGGLAVCADVRVGRPGSADEKLGGDGAAALVFGDGPVIAEVLATAALTDEFLDRWRMPTEITGRQWEERFGTQRYSALVRAATEQALDGAGVIEADHVVVVCPNAGIVKAAGALVKGRKTIRSSPVGYSGAADAAIALCDVLDIAEPGDTILLVSATDGCDAMVLRAHAALQDARQQRTVTEQRAGGIPADYLKYLSWRVLVEFEPPRRPEPEKPAGPPSARGLEWKFGLTGTRCDECGFVHLPPLRVCRQCGSAEPMSMVRVAELGATVVTYTVDRLAYSPSPPMVQAVVDVDGGGRFTVEVADVGSREIQVGDRVGFAFRRLFTADGVHNYFWKAVLRDGQ
ncbi:zinc ribbon domain-containing protein [Mycobacterium sp. CVI_P3]|uniref:Zinc ribbon domain-containing protein n=1 Tax=Mycobacterium pinniadriaticum TaxID=2994102 RepID=A0ABT3SA50_9MYCO|nr:zinc ribbon domain-containing protein [Mycobacterium pinniadriaticum]MCX2929988.1 zinc ribbon domain-containing protein [Mycobacterium pinniadriaticum]MCX2936363.1 zinc ribbon domain-containing protein [Mycobacterium pinniadriaticum]